MSAPLAELRARAERVLGPRAPPTLETLLTSAEYFGLVTATPLQRAICRIADGRPLGELASHPHVIAAVGDVAALPSAPPRTMLLLAGVRGAKSMLAAAACVRQSQVVDLSGLGPGEMARVSCVSVKLDLANAVKTHLVGTIMARPKLKALLLEEPTSDRVVLRHPSGRPVEIMIVAGAAAGATLVARWSAGVIFDEAPRMVGAADGVVNLDDMRAAIASRLRDGAIVWEIGSPWAPFGPIYKTVTEHEGRPTKDLVVVRAQGPWMNPVWWTEERMADVKRTNPISYRTDVEGKFADPEESLLPSATLDACTRVELVEAPRAGHEYCAAIDPASRGNAFTLAIGTRREGKRIICKVRQWVGSAVEPLDLDEVLAEVATELRAYNGLDTAETDQWSTDALRALARRYGLKLVEWPMTQEENTEAYLDVARRFAGGEVELPPDPTVRADLLRVKKRVTQGGLVMQLPQTSDGRHCDFAPVIVRVVRRHVTEARRAPAPLAASEIAQREEAAALKRAQDRFGAPARPRPVWRR